MEASQPNPELPRQEYKRTASVTVEVHWPQLLVGLRNAIGNGDWTRFSEQDALELERLAQQVREVITSKGLRRRT